MNVNKEIESLSKDNILNAIARIDKEGIPKNAGSQYYDINFNSKLYPPKLVVSYAYKDKYGDKDDLDRNLFKGGKNTPAFKVLENNGFNIVEKSDFDIGKILNEFSVSYKNDVERPFSKELNSYKLLVNQAAMTIRSWVSDNDFDESSLRVKGSIGQGNTTYYPWLAIFDERVSSGATNGYYIVILISDDFNDLYLTLNQGSTQQSHDTVETTRKQIFAYKNKLDGFLTGRLPEKSLVKTKKYDSTNNGKKYEDTNIFYRKYIIKEFDSIDFYKHLEILINFYQDYIQTENIGEYKKIEAMDYEKIRQGLQLSNLIYEDRIVDRFVSSLATKQFVLLTGLSGSGKTKLAQAFAQWISSDSSQYCIIPVGADWTNREPLLGYPNALEKGKYVKPDNGVLDLLINAEKNPELPFFLILDEMNLSHVERYFADFLSVMESGGSITLHPGSDEWKDENGNWRNGVPDNISLPNNLFIIGTVNIDETTYMFSPKVLDRANVIEFRVTENDLVEFLNNPVKPDLEKIKGTGAGMAADFLSIAQEKIIEFVDKDIIKEELLKFFRELKKTGAEFGYRTSSEIFRFAGIVKKLTEADGSPWAVDEIIDMAVLQKLLPKLHGSRKKLEPVLKTLALLCFKDNVSGSAELLANFEQKPELIDADDNIRFKRSLEKILRMKKRVEQDGFTSFAEA